ncbi:MAG: PLP-dependent aminotransferase family protein [Eubacteriales bacterium]|nr:PLP-dependent aminotransferase family protein [Eubacteriales bacterium]
MGSGTDYLLNILFEVLPESASYGIEDPGFPRVAEALCQRKRNYSPIPLDESGVRLAELIKSNVDILAITPSHQFPSGCIYPMSRRSELLAWVEKLGRYIIEDDYDSEFKFETRPIPPLKSMDSAEKVIYLGSFSKSFSPAMRISYMVLPKSLMEAYHSKLILFPCPVPLLTQLVMADLIETGAFTRHLNRMRILYKKKREILLKELQQAREYWEIEGADAGLHLVIKLRDMAAKEFAAAALAAGIKVYPLSEYAITADTGERILLSYAQIALSEIELAARGLVGVAKGFAD